MDTTTRDHFGRICSGLPRQKRGHVPRCRTVGLAVVCSCSCGKKSPRQRYGNTAGWGYAVDAARRWYLRHTGQG